MQKSIIFAYTTNIQFASEIETKIKNINCLYINKCITMKLNNTKAE